MVCALVRDTRADCRPLRPPEPRFVRPLPIKKTCDFLSLSSPRRRSPSGSKFVESFFAAGSRKQNRSTCPYLLRGPPAASVYAQPVRAASPSSPAVSLPFPKPSSTRRCNLAAGGCPGCAILVRTYGRAPGRMAGRDGRQGSSDDQVICPDPATSGIGSPATASFEPTWAALRPRALTGRKKLKRL